MENEQLGLKTKFVEAEFQKRSSKNAIFNELVTFDALSLRKKHLQANQSPI
jgi:hypothetical protein